MTLYQRYDSLRNSIALLREQTLHTPGIEDWPSIQTQYTNLLSHTFSIATALQSPIPHFLSAQLATLHEFLENEAQDATLFGEEETKMSSLFAGGQNESALPPIDDKDERNQLPVLAVHPCEMIPDNKLNWLGTLLSTVPELDVSNEEQARVAAYDETHTHSDEATLAADLEAHDARSIGALRSWYHTLLAPDADGDTYDFAMRVEAEE